MSTTSPVATSARPRPTLRWRVVDIVVGAVIAVACGALFFGWNLVYSPITTPIGLLIPGFEALLYGVWLLAGPLVALVVRKPGAALFGELVAAFVSMVLGAQWGWDTLISGLLQGLGAEIVFALLLYRVWTWWAAALAGAGAGLAMVIHDLIVFYAGAGATYQTGYAAAGVLSGIVLAGIVAWLLVRALAATGALDRFAAGRELAGRV